MSSSLPASPPANLSRYRRLGPATQSARWAGHAQARWRHRAAAACSHLLHATPASMHPVVLQDVAEYWYNVLEKGVDKPTARALVSNIDVHQA